MKSHQPEVFGTTLQKTNLWVKEISDLLHWDDHHKAYHGLRAVLHVLRDRLPVPEAAHLGAQLPMLLRGFYYDNWKPAATPTKIKTAQEFYDAVRENFTADRNVNPMRLTEAVLKVLSANTSPGELEGKTHVFDSFGCAIQKMAPECNRCGCKIIGHGVENGGRIFCCANCARESGESRLRDRV